jgi:hypothetical protein
MKPPEGGGGPPVLAELGEDGGPARRVALRGFNLSGSAKIADRLGLPFSRLSDPDVATRARRFLPQLAADGFDLLRIPIVWEFFAPEPDRGPDPAIASEARHLVEYAGSLGFWIIVDVHQDLMGSTFARSGKPTWHGDGFAPWLLQQAYSDASDEKMPREWDDSIPWFPFFHHWAINYNENQTLLQVMRGLARDSVRRSFERFATQLASTFNGCDNILTYEVINEPLSTTMTPAQHLDLARAFLRGLGGAVSLQHTPTCSVMPAGDWLDGAEKVIPLPQIDTDPASILRRSLLPVGPLEMESGGSRIWLTTPHFYDVRADSPMLCPQPSRYEAAVAAAERLLATWSVVPVVGEFGCGRERRGFDQRHALWIDCFEKRGWSWCLWNFNPDAGPGGDDYWCDERYSVAEVAPDGGVRFDRSYYSLLRPFPRRLGGPLVDIRWDGTRFDVTIGRALRSGHRTEIHVPASLGAFVASGSAIEVRDRLVMVDTDAGDASLSIVLDGSRT